MNSPARYGSSEKNAQQQRKPSAIPVPPVRNSKRRKSFAAPSGTLFSLRSRENSAGSRARAGKVSASSAGSTAIWTSSLKPRSGNGSNATISSIRTGRKPCSASAGRRGICRDGACSPLDQLDLAELALHLFPQRQKDPPGSSPEAGWPPEFSSTPMPPGWRSRPSPAQRKLRCASQSPTRKGIRLLRTDELAKFRWRDLSENWLLILGGSKNPEVPRLLTLRHRPRVGRLPERRNHPQPSCRNRHSRILPSSMECVRSRGVVRRLETAPGRGRRTVSAASTP